MAGSEYTRILKASDGFNRANANPIGSPWTVPSGEHDFQIVSNQATPTDVGLDCFSVYTGVSFAAGQYITGKLTVNSTGGGGVGVGFVLRALTASLDCYRFVLDHAASNNLEIGKFVSGAHTALLTVTLASWSDGEFFTFEAAGSLLSVYRGPWLVARVRDTSFASGGGPGMALSGAVTSAAIDDTEVGILVPGTPSIGYRSQI